jgi:hypothetical protein
MANEMMRAAAGNIAKQFGGKTPEEMDAEAAAAQAAQQQAFASKLAGLQAVKDQAAQAQMAKIAPPPNAPTGLAEPGSDAFYEQEKAALRRKYGGAGAQ